MDWLTDPQHVAIFVVTVIVVASTIIPISLLVIKTFRSFQETAAYLNSLFVRHDDKPSTIEKTMTSSIQQTQGVFQKEILDSFRDSMKAVIDAARESDSFKNAVLEGLQKRLTELEADRKTDRDFYSAQFVAFRAALDSKDQRINVLCEEAEADRKTIAEQAAQLTELQNLKARVADLEKKVNAMLADNTELARQRDEAFAARDAALSEIARLTAELAEKVEALAAAAVELTALRLRVDNQAAALADTLKPADAPPVPTGTPKPNEVTA